MSPDAGPPPSLAERLRAGTRALHEHAESTTFLRRMLDGRIARASYARLLESLYLVYASMESSLERHEGHPVLSQLDFPELRRAPSLETDLTFWVGPSWPAELRASPAALDYVARIEDIATRQPTLLVGHLYTRYLGDLSGGQILARALTRAFRLTTEAGVAFYRFEALPDIRAFKERYRARLNELPTEDVSVDEIVAEARRAFALNIALFDELDAAYGD